MTSIQSIVKQGGEQLSYSNGARKEENNDKGRFDLIPWKGILGIAQRYQGGAKKYSAHNWRGGIPLSRYLDSMCRHAFQLCEGMTDEDHAAAVAWNAIAFSSTLDMIDRGLLPKELDDWSGKPWQKNFQATIDKQSNQRPFLYGIIDKIKSMARWLCGYPK